MTLEELHAAGLSNRAIARELGLAKITVDRKMRELGLKSNFKANRNIEPLEVRFWRNVSRQVECWEWTGTKNAKGYGTVTVDTKSQLAHRVALKLSGVAVPDALKVLHSCDNPPCVRPAHLSLGTNADNTADMVSKGRQRGSKGMKHPSSKLSDQNVLDIRREYGEGTTQTALGVKYGVSQPMIGYIVRNERWTHI